MEFELQSVSLACPGSAARAAFVPGRGCACVEATLVADDRPVDVVWAPPGFRDAAARPTSGGIPILCPYPGRLATTSVGFEGRIFEFEPRDTFGRPMHGFAHDRAWRIVSHSSDRLTAEFVLSRDAPERVARWPADFRLTVDWGLAPSRLSCKLTLEAFGRMPAAIGLHPYFPVPLVPWGHGEGCRLDIPASLWQPQQDLLPDGPLLPASRRVGFPGEVPLSGVVLDDVFTGLAVEAGETVCRLIDPAGATLSVRFSEVFSTCVLFTPPHRKAVCIEPYTCLPGGDAFETGRGWRILEAGERLEARMTVEAG